MNETDATERGAARTMTAVAEAVGAPDFILPWLDRFYEEDDAELVLAAAGSDAGQDLGLAGVDVARLERAVRRAVLDVDEAGEEDVYTPASFHDRLEIWAICEGWKDVPLAVREELVDWDVGFYAKRIRREVEAVRNGHPGDSYEAHYTYVLLHEAEAIVAAQDRVYLWPCDCRAIVGGCHKPMDVCLRFENDRGLGWEISRERAVDVLRAADKSGLMHTADLRDELGAVSSICNCCADCCYPHLGAQRLEASNVWPVRRHVARIDLELCEPCGLCARRCPFAAIAADSEGRPALRPADCRGCGLCATSCRADAIELVPLAAE